MEKSNSHPFACAAALLVGAGYRMTRKAEALGGGRYSSLMALDQFLFDCKPAPLVSGLGAKGVFWAANINSVDSAGTSLTADFTSVASHG